MTSTTSTWAEPARKGLARDLEALYRDTRARVGREDLAHIRRVAAYSQAIERRSRELMRDGGPPDALSRAVVLRSLHVLLEFSELGHNIMHGGYDHLPDCGAFHSERFRWDFVTDPREWKVMHHRNHHPFTNVVGKDHDIGYSFVRLLPGQDWLAHHGVQPVTIAALIAFHLYYFTIYTATSAARVEGRPVLSAETFRRSRELIVEHLARSYVREPLAARSRALHTLVGNYLGTTLGYDFTVAILLLAHHAPNVQLFADLGSSESQDDYFRRQILATTNFTPIPELDELFKRVLREEVRFDDPPGHEVFYGGLDTHIEHHLFPDLPCNRQREIAPRVAEICAAHGLPYNVVPFGDVVPDLVKALARWAAPVGEHEASRETSLLRRPGVLLRRLAHGVLYSTPPSGTYLRAPRFFNVPTRVVETTAHVGQQAMSFRLEKPAGWDDVKWDAGAFLSLRVRVGGESLVRQYSLTRDSLSASTLDITVKRVRGGRASNHLIDTLRRGQQVTLVGVPTSEGRFVMTTTPRKVLFVAGGVGITPIVAMIRALHGSHLDAVQKGANGPTDALLVYCNRDESSVLFEDELRVISNCGWLKVRFLCDELRTKRQGLERARLSRELLQASTSDLTDREVYACAPGALLDIAQGALRDLGVPDDRFHVESFSPAPLKRGTVNDDRTYVVRFTRSGATTKVRGDMTLLEAARSAGIDVPTGCERGLCKACVVTKHVGRTQHDEHASAPQARVTVCNSFARSDLDLEL